MPAIKIYDCAFVLKGNLNLKIAVFVTLQNEWAFEADVKKLQVSLTQRLAGGDETDFNEAHPRKNNRAIYSMVNQPVGRFCI